MSLLLLNKRSKTVASILDTLNPILLHLSSGGIVGVVMLTLSLLLFNKWLKSMASVMDTLSALAVWGGGVLKLSVTSVT